MKLDKLKKYFNIYSLGIICCIIVVIIGLCFFLKPKKSKTTPDGIEIIDTNVKEDGEISEEKAKEVAVKQFKKIGEKVSKDDLTIKKIKRQGEEYYYIVSKENTMEIKIKGGKITRVNSAPIEE